MTFCQGGLSMHCLQDFNHHLEEEFLTKLQSNFMNDYNIDFPSASKIALDVLDILKFTDALSPQLSHELFS
jgi:hypothetical protein